MVEGWPPRADRPGQKPLHQAASRLGPPPRSGEVLARDHRPRLRPVQYRAYPDVARPLRRAVRGALLHRGRACEGVKAAVHPRRRSEEHTSELQSLMRISYAVFCLKKKTPTNNYT